MNRASRLTDIDLKIHDNGTRPIRWYFKITSIQFFQFVADWQNETFQRVDLLALFYVMITCDFVSPGSDVELDCIDS